MNIIGINLQLDETLSFYNYYYRNIEKQIENNLFGWTMRSRDVEAGIPLRKIHFIVEKHIEYIT